MKLAICFLFLAPLLVNAQTLVVAECVSTAGVCSKEELVGYHFRSGALASREVILRVDVSRVRFDLRQNHIYRNRYVITRWGDIVDVQNKKLLHDGEGEYVASEGDRIIQHLEKSDQRGYFYYDLKTKEFARLKQPGKWALPGLLSPDQTRSLETPNGDSIWLHDLIEKKRLLGSGFQIGQAVEASFFPSAPVFWLDDQRILSQRNNGEIVLVSLDGKVTPVATIPIKDEKAYSPPRFFRDRAGRIVYGWSGWSFVINVEEKSYTPLEWVALGFGFEAESVRNATYGHIIRYEGKEIGRLWASIHLAPAMDGYAAFEYGDVGSNLGYPKGIKVWSRATAQWTTIDRKSSVTLIGWIDG